MPTINLLDKKVYNRIAAGEVVERPFSVIKELVENSIDAGADEIEITIEDGGKSFISVKDNGCGISADDLKKAFLPHATSKIKDVEDLDDILTLGFRGEALASIGAVSMATITSKTEDAEIGNSISCNGGVIGKVEAYPSDKGTTVTVEKLFYNTPARAKFLKPTKNEETDITSIITRLILANSSVAFKYVADGKTVLQSYGGGLDEAIVEMYGYDAITDCIKIETVKNGMRVSGYIGHYYFTKPNKSYQTIILNGRYIINSTIQSAIHNAYASYLMKRKYPFYVLEIEMSPEMVDVNVHPNKTDVRFVDNQVVYGTLYSIVSKVLDGSASALNIIKPNNYMQIDPGSRPIVKKPVVKAEDIRSVYSDEPYVPTSNNSIFSTITNDKTEEENEGLMMGFEDFLKERNQRLAEEEERNKNLDDIFAENKKYIEKIEAEKAEKERQSQEQYDVGKEFRVVGQILTTYLVLEKGEDVYFVDQHAAHERLLYDKFMEEYKKGVINRQSMLIPYTLRLNEKETEVLINKLDELKKNGFDISREDNVFNVYCVPLLLDGINLKDFFDDILSDAEFKRENVPEIIHEKIAMKACKAAIKSGKTLSEDEIQSLLKAMNNDMGLRCPHGRPVTVRITRAEIDKWFKRIV